MILTFNNNAITQQHNWVIVQDMTKETAAAAGLCCATNDWVSPDDANVIVHSKLISAVESKQITFQCHNLTMFGTFIVTP